MKDTRNLMVRAFDLYLRGEVLSKAEANRWSHAASMLPIPGCVVGQLVEIVARCVKPDDAEQQRWPQMGKLAPWTDEEVVFVQAQLAEAFAKRKVEGTETEGMPAPDSEASLKARIIEELEGWREWAKEMDGIDLSDAEHIPTGPAYWIDGIDKLRESAIITTEHAYSLAEMVKYFKEMVAMAEMSVKPGRSDELTTAYCDELLKDLEEGD